MGWPVSTTVQSWGTFYRLNALNFCNRTKMLEYSSIQWCSACSTDIKAECNLESCDLHCIVHITGYCIVQDISLYCIVQWFSVYCIALYCIVVYCIALYCIVVYYIALHCDGVLYCIVLYWLYCIALYCIVHGVVSGRNVILLVLHSRPPRYCHCKKITKKYLSPARLANSGI